LKNPKAQLWGALQPSIKSFRNEIWLGPGGPGNHLTWYEPVAPFSHSVTRSDNFDRSAANLAGFSDGSGVTWVEAIGTAWTGANNRAECNNIPTDTGPKAVASTDCDSADMFAEFTSVVFTRNSTTYLALSPEARQNNTGTSGYAMVADEMARLAD
jgi:hypothetical protein